MISDCKCMDACDRLCRSIGSLITGGPGPRPVWSRLDCDHWSQLFLCPVLVPGGGGWIRWLHPTGLITFLKLNSYFKKDINNKTSITNRGH